MKQAIIIKLFLTVFLAYILPVFVFGQLPLEQRQTIVEYIQEPSQDSILYEDEIKENELPDVVINSLKASYPEHKISTVYRGSNGSYKIKLLMNHGKVAAYYDTGGEFLKLEEDKDDSEENTNDQWR